MKSDLAIRHFFRNRTLAFFVSFLSVFVVTLGALSAFDILPEPRPQDLAHEELIEDTATTVIAVTENPVKIVAPDIALNQIVSNPSSVDIKTLDAALLKGAVRYPGSAKLGEEGNVLIFGHSSYLKTIFNQAYKAFNGIQNLKVGQTITVYSGTTAYDYRVTSVRFAKATDEDVIDLSNKSRRLTLVTCNTFKTKSDRFVVEAEFVSSQPL